MVDWAWPLGARQHHFVLLNDRGHNRVPGGLVASQGTPMPPPDKFDWYAIGAALLVILVIVVAVELLP